MLKGIQLYNINRQWWEGISKEMLVITWIPPNTPISGRNVIFQVELVVILYHLFETGALSHRKSARHI